MNTIPTNTPVQVTSKLAGPTGQEFRLKPVERNIIDRLGGKPWTAKDFTTARLSEAKRVWAAMCLTAGYSGPSRWTTDETTNPKLGKAGVPTVGVSLLAATSALTLWTELSGEDRTALAAAIGESNADITKALSLTVCPYSTPGCRRTCVVDQSFRALADTIRYTRLMRNILTMMRPDLALCLTADALNAVVRRAGGVTKARWRVNIADDIRWELVAPGLLEFAPLAYTYTKLPAAERPQVPGLRIVYSANERWSDADIIAATEAGNRVAVVFDVPKAKLPAVWNGVTVEDGDATDDLFEHPKGRIVGLAAKGRNRDVIKEMRESGFSRPV